ncbi:uncharacterized protein HMPREF1541_10559 [Cyphellophora europaea CBS 101466]|uniref:Uncharacterized protein n=1 Tax=Cyphellophora europaea (strain CBS 101466) TaxID=1220924 RepID=W2S910_CYPE1|nr:uncharacterized protein HMPREF1541_10559 [Cyphellophora europaea CBS 101466]ETN44379.1 hypothetical protein HMPREF1541_10559 [Cyphellophora europaea CBS 101466]
MAPDGTTGIEFASAQDKLGFTGSSATNGAVDYIARSESDHLNHPDSPPVLQRENSSNIGKHMLEGVYSVEARTEQPRKKVKTDNESTEASSYQHQKFNSSGTGIVGEYMNPAKDADAADKPTLMPAGIVDLTNDDEDDDELQVIGTNTVVEKQVCYGALYANVDAHLVPKPKGSMTGFGGAGKDQWPLIPCTLRRPTEATRDTIVQVIDPHGKYFANVEHKLAKVLAPALNIFPGFRVVVRLLNRRHHPGEWHHQPCSQTMKVTLVFYGRKYDAEKIGRMFGQENLWFINTSFKEPGIEMLNPQKMRNVRQTLQQQQARPAVARSVTYDTVSPEEAEQTVAKIFNHYASEKIAETEPANTVLTSLLPHQKQALTFMLRHESRRTFGEDASGNSTLWHKKHHKSGAVYYEEAVSQMTCATEPPQVYGGLLADVMGLGKTLESLTLIAATTAEASEYAKTPMVRSHEDKIDFRAYTKGTLIVCPMSTVANWENQIKEHLDGGSITWYTHHGSNRIRNPYELCKFDIVITTYGTLQSESRQGKDNALRSLKWFRVVLDEAHTIRESSAQQSQACFQLEAQRRWCLTGTPIQNKLADLGSLCQFLRLWPYDTAQNFSYYIGKRAADGDPSFLLKLRIFIDSFTLRRLRDQISLPPKQDVRQGIKFSEAELKLHTFFRERARIAVHEMTKDKESKKQNLQVSVLQGITTLRLISAHGRDLLREADLKDYKGAAADEPIDLDDGDPIKTINTLEAYNMFKMMSDADFDICRNCERAIAGDSPSAEAEDDTRPRAYILPCRDLLCYDCFKVQKGLYDAQADQTEIQCPFCSSITASQYIPIEGSVSDTIERLQESREPTPAGEKSTYSGPHSKTRALIEDIHTMTNESKELEAKGEQPLKCVVFSEFTSHLTLIARALEDGGFRCGRIDGSMSLPKRKKVLNELDNDASMTVLLASVKAAGQGLNLTAASRVFIMEPLWNPAAEAQAVDRVYRIGQTRPVVVKRYFMEDSIETVIMELAGKKQALADVSLNRNHKALNKKEQREQHYNAIRALFEVKKR